MLYCIVILFLTFPSILFAISIYSPYVKAQTENAPALSSEEFSTYENSTYNVRIQYPSDWDTESGDNDAGDTTIDIVSFSPPNENDSATVSISLDELNKTETIDQLLGDSISDYQNDLNAFNTVESNTHTTLAGLPAYKLLYTYNDKGDNFKDMEIGTIVGNKAYYIQYENDPTQFDRDLPIVQKIIDSFEVIKK